MTHKTSEIYIKSHQLSIKLFLILSTISLFISSCSVSKKPEFRYIKNIKVKKVSMRNVTLSADAIFNNPNHLKGKLSIDNITIFVDNTNASTISSQEFTVPAKNEFAIPLEGTFSLSDIYTNNKKNILSSILKVIETDSLHIQYKGIIKYHLGSFSFPYEINKEQKINIK